MKTKKSFYLLFIAICHLSSFTAAAQTFCFSDTITLNSCGQNYSIINADFNGDGKLDLVMPSSLDSIVNLVLGDGLGNFNNAAQIAVSPLPFPSGLAVPYSVISGDFNGDTKADLAIGYWGTTDSIS